MYFKLETFNKLYVGMILFICEKYKSKHCHTFFNTLKFMDASQFKLFFSITLGYIILNNISNIHKQFTFLNC